MTKYAPLGDHLRSLENHEWRTDFDHVERVLGFRLPASARKHSAWWANDGSLGRHANVWLRAGWETESVSISTRHVTFRRSHSVTGPRKLPRPRTDRSSFTLNSTAADRPYAWDTDGKLTARVSLAWRPVGRVVTDRDGNLVFPAAPSGPGIYRIRFRRQGNEQRYVGEAANLRRRFYNYRKPGRTQQTSLRINQALREALADGVAVAVSIATDGLSLIRDGKVVAPDLTDKATRRLFEHFAQVVESDEAFNSLNR